MPRSISNKPSSSTAKDAAIHEEFAGLYRDWAKHAPAEKRSSLRN